MERGDQGQNIGDDEAAGELTGAIGTPGGSATHDYGGLEQHSAEVDLDAASEVGADPPGPMGIDISGADNSGQGGEASA
ncbi:MAG: hypothetical protein M3R24_17905 [Chloroflexota bacterium]|nr:hypothetical protein [Chloroflexota bacterium]PLS82801.1 MAG: hypothetical protein CYG59_03000 [Chloroflexota bacterium]